MEFGIVIEGLQPGDFIGNLSPEKVRRAAHRALNRIAERARTRSDRAIREQIAFPASYLGPASKRLWVQTKASKTSLEAVVRGQGRPTSLARFTRQKPPAPGQPGRGNAQGGVNVRVKAGGGQKLISRAFLIRLKNNNVGLAVRTRGGQPPGSYKPKEIGNNLWLLYGPSVDQALLDAQAASGIYVDFSDEWLDLLNNEFARLIDLETSNA